MDRAGYHGLGRGLSEAQREGVEGGLTVEGSDSASRDRVRLGMDVYRRFTRGALGQITAMDSSGFQVRSRTGAERWIALNDVWRVAPDRVVLHRAAAQQAADPSPGARDLPAS